MNFTWTYDAPSGVYKQHEMSEKLREAAIVKTVFMQFVNPEPGFGKKKGESVTITRVSNLAIPSNARLTEGQPIPENQLSLSTVAIVVKEWGRAVPFTSLSKDLSKFDPENIIQKELIKQKRVIMDNAAAEAMTSSSVKVKAIPDGVSSLTFDTDGVASTAATVNLNFYHLERIRDYMHDTLQVPGYDDAGNYVGILSTKAARGIKDDPKFADWKKYTEPQAKFNSEIGMIESIRVVESNNTSALSKTLGTGSVLGEAIVFGDDFCAMAEAESPELRVEIPKDFGRQKAIAWYGVLEFGVVWDTANAGEARGVHVTSS